ncbi:uncharacterized protein [Epargyreus clarus]|uniref:uncharacterized protein isoform X1 n=1 Tax=Epargyreus clarus TaxID=520877 RepID=UPI003C2D338E
MEINTKECKERLIDEVKRYPVLYDTKLENHRDIDVRDRCWMEISERMGANCEVLKREWKILRDSLRQSLKKKRKGATTKSGLPCKKWRLESRMAFILPHMTVRRKYRQVKDTIKTDDAEVQSDQEQEAPAWDPRHTDQDALDLFFASACQSTRRLPRKYQNVVKRQILEVLMRVEDDFENDHNDNKSDVYKV